MINALIFESTGEEARARGHRAFPKLPAIGDKLVLPNAYGSLELFEVARVSTGGPSVCVFLERPNEFG